MSRINKFRALIAVVWLLAMVVGSSAQTVAGRWVIVECSAGTIYGAQGSNGATVSLDNFMFRSEKDKCVAIGFPQSMELLRDGTGIVDNDSKSWKTQGNRIYFMGSPARAFNYNLSGTKLTLTNDNKNEATYLEPSAAQAYIEKVAIEQRRKQQEIEEVKRKEAEAKRLEIERKRVESMAYFIDSRNGQKYRTVKIGAMTWMAENLNYKIGNSWCYNNDDSKCRQYGRLYDWNTAKTACPAGFHLPSKKEWVDLIRAAGDDSDGTKMKSASGWANNGNGTDDYGFSALPGGYRYSGGKFDNVGNIGYWWTAQEWGNNFATYRCVGCRLAFEYGLVGENSGVKSLGYSVRCVQD